MPSLQFKGKTFVDNHHLSVPFHELRPVAGKGTGKKPASLHDNLVIHGDNLAALKALLPTYHNKVKCIYIDPPYNTGNEGWAYNDNVNSPMMQDWLGKTVDRDDLTRHDKWCCMMLPRLKLLRDLLSDDGAIFISIDDNEIHHLRDLMDEVFGDGNFVATVIWEKVYSPKSSAKFFSDNHDFIVVYARNKCLLNLGSFPEPNRPTPVTPIPTTIHAVLGSPATCLPGTLIARESTPLSVPVGNSSKGPLQDASGRFRRRLSGKCTTITVSGGERTRIKYQLSLLQNSTKQRD